MTPAPDVKWVALTGTLKSIVSRHLIVIFKLIQQFKKTFKGLKIRTAYVEGDTGLFNRRRSKKSCKINRWLICNDKQLSTSIFAYLLLKPMWFIFSLTLRNLISFFVYSSPCRKIVKVAKNCPLFLSNLHTEVCRSLNHCLDDDAVWGNSLRKRKCYATECSPTFYYERMHDLINIRSHSWNIFNTFSLSKIFRWFSVLGVFFS
jgi:hypothetical protein